MTVRHLCRLLVTTVLAAAGVLLASAPAWAIDTNFTYQINPQHNFGKCVDVQGGSTANGAHLIQFDCGPGPNQKFRFTPLGGGIYTISPVHAPGKCVALEGGGTGNGVQLIQTTCLPVSAQQFRILGDRPQAGLSGARIQAVLGNRCLDVPGSSNANSVRLHMFTCHGGANQRFDLVAFA